MSDSIANANWHHRAAYRFFEVYHNRIVYTNDPIILFFSVASQPIWIIVATFVHETTVSNDYFKNQWLFQQLISNILVVDTGGPSNAVA